MTSFKNLNTFLIDVISNRDGNSTKIELELNKNIIRTELELN